MMVVDGGGRAHFCKDGSTVCPLWAAAKSSLKLEIDGRQVAMERQDEGWFAVRLDHQPVGALYCYMLSDGRRVPDPASRFQPLGVDGPSLLCASVETNRLVRTPVGRGYVL